MDILPLGLILFIVSIFGLIIGSFLNVVIYRLHTGKSLNGNSHCLSCGRNLRWFELVPVLSYLLLFGRCRTCGSYIPGRYLLVELLTALLFVVAWLSSSSFVGFLFLTIFISLLIVGAVYDLYHMIIPDEVSFSTAVMAVLWSVYLTYLTGDLTVFWHSLLAGILASGFLFILWLVSRGRWIGFGDAKIAFSLGTLCQLSGVFSFMVFSFWVGAIVGLGIVGINHLFKVLRITRVGGRFGYVKMKSEIPFAPFLIIAFFLVYFGQLDVLRFSSYVASLLY